MTHSGDDIRALLDRYGQLLKDIEREQGRLTAVRTWASAIARRLSAGEAVADEQIDMALTLSKGDFSFSVVETDDIAGPDNDDTRAVISYGMTF